MFLKLIERQNALHLLFASAELLFFHTMHDRKYAFRPWGLDEYDEGTHAIEEEGAFVEHDEAPVRFRLPTARHHHKIYLGQGQVHSCVLYVVVISAPSHLQVSGPETSAARKN